MPLDSRKITHIQAVTTKTFASRQQTVVFCYQSGGSYSYTAVSVIWRPEDVIDPEIPNVAGAPPKAQFDVMMIAPIATSFTGVVFVANTSTATAGACAAAQKFQVIEAIPVGIVPGGTHFRVLLRRMR